MSAVVLIRLETDSVDDGRSGVVQRDMSDIADAEREGGTGDADSRKETRDDVVDCSVSTDATDNAGETERLTEFDAGACNDGRCT